MSRALRDLKWVAALVNTTGGWGLGKGPIPACIKIVVGKSDFPRALNILTTGHSAVEVVRHGSSFTLSLKGQHADDWIRLAGPYLDMESRY